MFWVGLPLRVLTLYPNCARPERSDDNAALAAGSKDTLRESVKHDINLYAVIDAEETTNLRQ